MTDSLETSDREAEDPREPIRLPVREMRDEPAPQRAAQEGDLPPLPEPDLDKWSDAHVYTADQMREYARLALALALAAAGGGVPKEPARPDILERLSYHALERDDLTLDECLEYLAKGWTKVHGRTARQMVMQILALLASSPQPEAAPAQPIDMILHCPACGTQHIDAPKVYECQWPICNCAGTDGPPCQAEANSWENPPHRSHLCHGCGHIWRPADVPTNGVAAIETKGKADSPAPEAPAQAAPSAGEVEREPVSITSFDEFTEASDHCLLSTDQDLRHQAKALRDFAMPALRWAEAQITEHREDTRRLDWLDATNERFRMGWKVGQAPAGNVSVQSVIQLGPQPLTTIRAAIDAALNQRKDKP